MYVLKELFMLPGVFLPLCTFSKRIMAILSEMCTFATMITGRTKKVNFTVASGLHHGRCPTVRKESVTVKKQFSNHPILSCTSTLLSLLSPKLKACVLERLKMESLPSVGTKEANG